jgi:trehalose transport system substrate-binding protein
MFFPGRPNVQITYYNTDVFDGNTYRIPETWDELLEVAKRLKAAYNVGKVAIHGTLDTNTTTQVFEFVTAAGETSRPQRRRLCEGVHVLAGAVSVPEPGIQESQLEHDEQILSEETLFLARNWPVGMQVIVKQNQKTNIKAYATWAGPGGRATMIGGDVIAITKRSPHQELALKFAATDEPGDPDEAGS